MTPVFDFVADLHVDLWDGGIKSYPVADYKNEGSEILVIGGDISNHLDEVYIVINRAVDVYDTVVFVDGNHEHYFTDTHWSAEECAVPNAVRKIKKQVEDLGAVFFGGTESLQVGDTLFVGANGWYDFRCYEESFSPEQARQAWLEGSNDPKRIQFPLGGPQGLAYVDAMNIASKVRHAQQDNTVANIAVVTHSSPHPDMMRLTGDPFYDSMTGAYCNRTMEMVREADAQKKITTWCFGHTHDRKEKVIDGIRYVNNARGYQSENGNNWFAIQIDPRERYE